MPANEIYSRRDRHDDLVEVVHLEGIHTFELTIDDSRRGAVPEATAELSDRDARELAESVLVALPEPAEGRYAALWAREHPRMPGYVPDDYRRNAGYMRAHAAALVIAARSADAMADTVAAEDPDRSLAVVLYGADMDGGGPPFDDLAESDRVHYLRLAATASRHMIPTTAEEAPK